MEAQRQEEEEAVASDKRVSFWLELIVSNRTPSEMVWRIQPIAVRALSKAIAANASLLALDLCNADLGEDVGETLGRVLGENKHLKRLDLDCNRFGPKTLVAIANGLCQNPDSALVSLSMERNPLTTSFPEPGTGGGGGSKGKEDFTGLRTFCVKVLANCNYVSPETLAVLDAEAAASAAPVKLRTTNDDGDPLTEAELAAQAASAAAAALAAREAAVKRRGGAGSRLVHLNLFQCGLKREGGRMLALCLRSNTTLTHLQLSSTDEIDGGDLSSITDILKDNQKATSERLAADKARRAAKRREEEVAKRIAAAEAAAAAEVAWIDAQQAFRDAQRQKERDDEAMAEARRRMEADTEEREKISKWKAEQEAKAKTAATKDAKKKK